MTTRRINQTLWSLAALFGTGAAAALVLGVMLPLASVDTSKALEVRATDGAGASPSLPQLAALEPLWSLRLRAESRAPSPNEQPQPSLASASPSTEANTAVPVTLVGTIGDSLAMLRDASGAVEVKGVGESAGGVEVLEVRPARVQVRYNGQVHTLQRPPEAAGGL